MNLNVIVNICIGGLTRSVQVASRSYTESDRDNKKDSILLISLGVSTTDSYDIPTKPGVSCIL